MSQDEFAAWVSSGTEIAEQVRGEIFKAVTGETTLAQIAEMRKLTPKESMKALCTTVFELADANEDAQLQKPELIELLAVKSELNWSEDQIKLATGEILMGNETASLNVLTKWLGSQQTDLSVLFVQQTKLAIPYRAAVAREKKAKKHQKGGFFSKFKKGDAAAPEVTAAEDLFEQLDDDATGMVDTLAAISKLSHHLHTELDSSTVMKELDPGDSGVFDEETFVKWYVEGETMQALLAAKDNATKMEALALEIISGLHQVLGSVSSNHSL